MTGRRGFALLLVLWALVLLGVLAMAFSLSMRTEARAARYSIDDARAYFQARTGVERAMMLLSTEPADNVTRTVIVAEDGDLSYRVRVTSESGKIDVNFVSEDDLREILAKGGMEEGAAERLRDAIEDWRDGDDDSRSRGAEFPEYSRLKEPLRPRNADIRSVDELRYVEGVTPEFHERFLSRVFTTYGNSPHVNPLQAPKAVLEALPGVSPEAAAEILAKRAAEPPLSPADLAAMVAKGMLTSKGLALLSGRPASKVYAIVSTGRAGDGVVHTIRCLAEVGAAGRNKVKILGWLDQAPPEEEG
jgi:general secretion pathway protein K